MKKLALIGVWLTPVIISVFMVGSVFGANSDSERVTALKITMSAILEAQRVFVCSMGVDEICPQNWEVYQVEE